MASSNLSSSIAFCTSFVLKRKEGQVAKEAGLHTLLTQPAGLEEGLLDDAFTPQPSFQEAQEAHQAPSMSPPLLVTNQSCASPGSKPRSLGNERIPNPTSQAHNQYPK